AEAGWGRAKRVRRGEGRWRGSVRSLSAPATVSASTIRTTRRSTLRNSSIESVAGVAVGPPLALAELAGVAAGATAAALAAPAGDVAAPSGSKSASSYRASTPAMRGWWGVIRSGGTWTSLHTKDPSIANSSRATRSPTVGNTGASITDSTLNPYRA